MLLVTWRGNADRLFSKYSAATPATCGAAIEVPPIVRVAVLLVCQAEVIELPGAIISTHVPILEKAEIESDEFDEATVIALATRAGL